MNLARGEVRDPYGPAPLPACPATLEAVVDLVAEAVERPGVEVATVLSRAMPRLSHRRSLLWITAETAAVAGRFLTGPGWWHRPRTNRFVDFEVEAAPWRRLADGVVGYGRPVEAVHGALGQDLAAAWWPGPVEGYDVNAPWWIGVPPGVEAGERFAVDDGVGNRIWCHAARDDDGRLVGRASREPHPPGPYERLWPRGQSPYFVLGFGPHLFPGEHTVAGDAVAFALAREAIQAILPHLHEQAARFPAETVAVLGSAAVSMRDLTAACAAESALRELVQRGRHPLAGTALMAERQLHVAVDSCLFSPRT